MREENNGRRCQFSRLCVGLRIFTACTTSSSQSDCLVAMGAQFCKCLDTPSPGPKPSLSPKPPLNGYTPPPDSKRRPEPVIGKRINLEDQFDSAASPDDGPRCKDGSRDMRFKANRGKEKYDSVARHEFGDVECGSSRSQRNFMCHVITRPKENRKLCRAARLSHELPPCSTTRRRTRSRPSPLAAPSKRVAAATCPRVRALAR